MYAERNARRLILDGPIGVGKTTLLRQYAASFSPSTVSTVPHGFIIRPTDAAPILVFPELQQSSDYRRSLRTDEDSSDRLSKLVDVQLDLVSSVFDRELYMLKFLAANPGAAVVQELGYSSLRRTLKFLRQTFTPVAYSVLSALLDSLAQTEEGAFRCLLTVPEEMEEEIVRRVQGRSHVYHAPEVVRSCARMYRETAEEFDAVWNPEEENVKMNLTAVVERFE